MVRVSLPHTRPHSVRHTHSVSLPNTHQVSLPKTNKPQRHTHLVKDTHEVCECLCLSLPTTPTPQSHLHLVKDNRRFAKDTHASFVFGKDIYTLKTLTPRKRQSHICHRHSRLFRFWQVSTRRQRHSHTSAAAAARNSRKAARYDIRHTTCLHC